MKQRKMTGIVLAVLLLVTGCGFSQRINVYMPTEDGDGFQTEKATVHRYQPQTVMDALYECGVLQEKVTVLEFEEVKQDKTVRLTLDVTEELSEQLRAFSAEEEYYVVGSIYNTFLSAYEADEMEITVAGERFETAHGSYPGYLIFFE